MDKIEDLIVLDYYRTQKYELENFKKNGFYPCNNNCLARMCCSKMCEEYKKTVNIKVNQKVYNLISTSKEITFMCPFCHKINTFEGRVLTASSLSRDLKLRIKSVGHLLCRICEEKLFPKFAPEDKR